MSLQTTILDLTKMAESYLENAVGKAEIAHYEQFFLYPQCFQKTCTADTEKLELVLERVNKSYRLVFGKVLRSFYSLHNF